MTFKKLKSFAKINLSLNVIKRLPNNYHNIESLVTFTENFDEIKIKIIRESKHKISFSGKFSKGIGKNNTVSKLFNLLEKNKLIKNKKFEIKVTKNVPQKSGMGGGSMNAACVLKHLMKRKIATSILTMRRDGHLSIMLQDLARLKQLRYYFRLGLIQTPYLKKTLYRQWMWHAVLIARQYSNYCGRKAATSPN